MEDRLDILKAIQKVINDEMKFKRYVFGEAEERDYTNAIKQHILEYCTPDKIDVVVDGNIAHVTISFPIEPVKTTLTEV